MLVGIGITACLPLLTLPPPPPSTNQTMGAKKKGAGAKKGGKGKKDKKPRDAVGEAVNEVEEAERKVSAFAVGALVPSVHVCILRAIFKVREDRSINPSLLLLIGPCR